MFPSQSQIRHQCARSFPEVSIRHFIPSLGMKNGGFLSMRVQVPGRSLRAPGFNPFVERAEHLQLLFLRHWSSETTDIALWYAPWFECVVEINYFAGVLSEVH